MEIDLNSAVAVDKNCCSSDSSASCCTNTTTSSSSGGTGVGGGGGGSICLELWHACAGPLIYLPKKGHTVVYFPQGHLEQVLAASSYFKSLEHHQIRMLTYDLPPQIFCRVLDVKLHADQENDDVYAQVTLLPELESNEVCGKNLEEDEESGSEILCKTIPHMFCKTLTASDTSTHGGFSVPRRAAEDCFPPLDYSQQRPSQELVAKDLHGTEWKFRHIYRGQPRRHLLTTGWSVFVNQKGLVSGDAVLFLRGEDGELRLGIRRASRPPSSIPYSVLSSQGLHLSILSPAANALSTKSMFHVFYSPRASPSEFVIPYWKYVKSLSRPISIGMRFKMRLEMEDSAEKRCTGAITGACDVDPLRWPNSKWRCLMVRWDDSSLVGRQERVSPWEIEPSLSLPALSCPVAPRIKRLQTCLMSTLDGMNPLEFAETVRSHKVLQGQENVAFAPTLYRSDPTDNYSEFKIWNPSQKPLQPPMLETNAIGYPVARSVPPGICTSRDLHEHELRHKVFQGQEVFPLTSKPLVESGRWVWKNYKQGLGELSANERPDCANFPGQNVTDTSVSSAFLQPNMWRIYGGSSHGFMNKSYDVESSESMCFRSNSLTSPKSNQSVVYSGTEYLEPLEECHQYGRKCLATVTTPTSRDKQSDKGGNARKGCKLFGFPLNLETNGLEQQDSLTKRTLNQRENGRQIYTTEEAETIFPGGVKVRNGD
uniref:Auxin response factor n=1 Tax=Cabomba aquatica TaxID=310672 RepID=D4HTS9_9MAGN|nr:ARF4 protein [Cabomba aquatica]